MTWQLHTYGAGTVARPDLPDCVAGPTDLGADPQAQLRADRLYLIRTDEFVAASIPLHDNKVDTAELQAAMSADLLLID